MKVLIVFLISLSVALAALTAEQIAKIEPISKKCREETGATLEQVNKIRLNNLAEADAVEKKQICCVMKKTEICKDGKLNVEKVRRIAKASGATDEVIAKILACDVAKDTHEETAYQFLKCAIKALPNFTVVE